MTTMKRLALNCCPPVVWGAARWCYRHLKPLLRIPPGRRMISTRAEVDEMVALCDARAAESLDAMTRTMAEYHFRVPTSLPTDPASPEYHAAQMALYRLISGRDDYRPGDCEQTPFDLDRALLRPFPYNTHSCLAVGEQLLGIGFLLAALDLPRPARVLELGPGYGKLTSELALLGHHVTAVDISPAFLELGRRRCAMLGLEVETACAGMLDYQPPERFDRVVFNEAFHHCHDHQAMVRRLEELVSPGGAVLFANEPISDSFYFPWGLRLDGQSLYCTRAHGWLELGFRTDYFLRLLARHGWRAERRVSRDLPHLSAIVARRR